MSWTVIEDTEAEGVDDRNGPNREGEPRAESGAATPKISRKR